MHPQDSRSGNNADSGIHPTSYRSKSTIALLLCAASVIVVAAIASKAAFVSSSTDDAAAKQHAVSTQSDPAVDSASVFAFAAVDTTTVSAPGNTSSLIANASITSARAVTTKRATKPAAANGASQLRALPNSMRTVSTTVAPSLVNSASTLPQSGTPLAENSVLPTMTGPTIVRPSQSVFPLRGILFEIEGITDASSGTSGMSGAHAFRTLESFAVTVSFDSLIGWSGLTFYAQRAYRKGRNGSGEAGLLQGVSNIDADNFNDWGEVFGEQRAFGDRLRIKAGRLDFNKEFAGTDNGGDFLNPAMGFSPSITAAPTYPLPVKAANVFYAMHPQLNFAVGAFDGLKGAPAKVGGTSRFLIAQANASYAVGGGLEGRMGIGAFKHTGVFASVSESGAETADASENEIAGTSGWYLTLDQTLWNGAVSTGDDEPRTVGAFFQYGKSNPTVAGVRAHAGGGVVATGVVPGLRSGVLGLGATRVNGSDGRELIGELFYKTPLFSRLSVVMDGQRVNQADVFGSRRAGTVFTLRTIVTF